LNWRSKRLKGSRGWLPSCKRITLTSKMRPSAQISPLSL
jgi:hypothetical protein